ncbi:SprT-like domain-containing protein [Terrimonas sp. NA20]|uniref:SprT-like domain-containing protein n=1 Tax=Terrimonas ginsenosidimutans TaxID=2908004 RepID=A0ABS9KTE6_9BACT|nr:SprT-like domain-containing protein [Terrimonas ginsenosidimutans]MCG2615570.1 SprT-like domain-containing protein [Terrimonas ginsenosidimutans]
MAKQEVPIGRLQDYLPPGTYEPVLVFLREHKVHLTVARERKSILGDYRHRTQADNHRISVNGNLNKYSFLITLLHELAHLLTFERYGNKVFSHGKEWKMVYGSLLADFLRHKIFPEDIEQELMRSLQNPAASTCAEDGLLRVLRRYDASAEKVRLVEELPLDAIFRTADGRIFQKKEKLRKRFRCVEIKTKKVYLFSPVYEVEPLTAG